MNPVLAILALIVGVAHLWLAFVFASYLDDLSEAMPLSVPLAVIGLAVLLAAGLTMGGVLT